jgi:hypothetical protein
MRTLARLRNILFWSVLTASTVGPGTVAMCSKAGADFRAALLWCVLVAAFVAWVMQDGAGRLTIESGMSLGQAIRRLTPSGTRRVLRGLLTAFVVVGSFAYECNNFSGTAAVVPMLTDDDGVYTAIAALNGPICLVLLLAGTTQTVAMALGVVVGLMALAFAVVVANLGVPPGFGAGLLPSIPEGAAEVALGVMGTTSVPLNLLLSSSIARGASLQQMHEGVACASVLSGLISMLIQVAGARAHDLVEGGGSFSLVDLAHVFRRVGGGAGTWCFALGLYAAEMPSSCRLAQARRPRAAARARRYAAGISSSLTVPLGTALALEDLLGLRAEGRPMAKLDMARQTRTQLDPPPSGVHAARRALWRRVRERLRWSAGGRSAFMAAMVALSMIPSLLRLPTISVILTAQVAPPLDCAPLASQPPSHQLAARRWSTAASCPS